MSDAGHSAARSGPIPARAGIGLRACHHRTLIEQRPAVHWLEAHSENYFGAAATTLEQLRDDYPLSLHGVGLSLGSTDQLAPEHLEKLAALVARIEPAIVSEHVSWGATDGEHLNDLLPLPYTEEALTHLVRRIVQVQERLGRQILVENVSSYVEWRCSRIPEYEFLSEVARRSGCGLLLDVNNVYVSACNHGFDARRYIDAIPPALVAEMHLAGHSVDHYEGREILVDTHGSRVIPAVWALFDHAVEHVGAVPTLIEWDTDVPALEVLLDEAASADALLRRRHVDAA